MGRHYVQNEPLPPYEESYVEVDAQRKIKTLSTEVSKDRKEIADLRKIIAIEEKDKKIVRGSLFLIKEILDVVDKEISFLEEEHGYEMQIFRKMKHRFTILHALRDTMDEMRDNFDEILVLEKKHEDAAVITERFVQLINAVLHEANMSLALVYKELKSHESDLKGFERLKAKLELLHKKLDILSNDERFVLKLEHKIKKF